MLGLNVKRGVATTLERVFKNSDFEFGTLNVLWTGRTAGIQFNRYGDTHLDATVIFPSIDESAEIPQTTFNNLIGYALHELGHAWFTENKPWDLARKRYGAYVGNLINGLEDPRIELSVIESQRAPNARALFVNLINSVLDRDGYVDPDDAKNIPFLLAVEGRRLNGYVIDVPNIIDDSIYAKHIHWALGRASKATNTSEIVKVAVELYKRIKQQDEEAGQGEGDGKGQPSDQPDGEQDGQPDGSNPAPKQDGDQDGDKQDGQGGDQAGDKDGDQDGDEQADGEQGDEPSKDPKRGGGKSYDGGREVEPNDFIREELKQHRSQADQVRPIPAVGKPQYSNFSWR